MEFVDSRRPQRPALFRRHGGGHELAGFGVPIETLEQPGQPVGNGGAAHGAEFDHLGEVGDRQDSGHDGDRDAGLPGAGDELEINLGVEEILGDRPARPGVDLAPEVIEIGL